MSNNRFEIAVVGLGAIGAATLWHLAKAGVRVVGIDQFNPPHSEGSSHGETRITRQSIGEGAAYIPLVQRSHALWRLIEKEAKVEILRLSGGLIVDSGESTSSHGVEGFARQTIQLAQKFGIPHEVLTVAEARRRFPEFDLAEGSRIYFEPGAGFVRPEVAIQSQLALAGKYGADIRVNTPVMDVEFPADGSVRITTGGGVVHAGKCLISVGSWIKPFLREDYRGIFRICRQTLHWLPVSPQSYSLESSPIFIWCYGASEEDMIYGFPSLDGKTIKVASEAYVESDTPDGVDRYISRAEQELFFKQKIENRLGRVCGSPVRSLVCQYTVTPRSQFIVERHPEAPQALIASCCSGHGFKHSAGLGEALAATLLDQEPAVDLGPFRRPWGES